MCLTFKHISGLLAGFALFGCTKVVDIPLPSGDPQIVISTYLIPGDTIKVLAGASLPFSQLINPTLDSLSTVLLYKNNVLIDTLEPKRFNLFDEFQSKAYLYTSAFTAEPNSSYKVQVKRSEIGMAFGADAMPGKPDLRAVTVDTTRKEVSFRLTNTDETDYYVFECFTKIGKQLSPILISNEDVRMKVYNGGVIYSGSSVEGGTRFYLKNENNDRRLLTFQYDPAGIALSDSLVFRASRVTQHYYLHELSKNMQDNTVPIFNEPSKLYTNIINGYGIVACAEETDINFLD
jgi:hypothetical protein